MRQCRRGGVWEEGVDAGKESREDPLCPQSGPTLGTANLS